MELVERLASALARSGIDVVTPLALSWYNDSIPAELGACIPARGAAGEGALAVLVGNSRALWEPFLDACATEDLLDSDNPLDLYLQRAVCGSLESAAPGLQHRIYWSHRRTDDLVPGPGVQPGAAGASEHVAFQRMAHHAGLAYLDESSHLCLHPRFGPWFSLRCVIIFDNIPWGKPQPRELPNPLPAATQMYVKMALHTAVHNTSKKFHLPEVDVEAAEAAMAEANIEPGLGVDIPAGGAPRSRSRTPESGRSGSQGGQQVGSAGSSGSRRSSMDKDGRPCIRAVAANWRAWVAVRDSPCPGHPMRYSEEQIVYHYTRDRAVLAKALLRRGCVPHCATPLPATGLLDPAYQAYHSAAMDAQKTAGVRRHYPPAPAGVEPITAA
ncbi:hypothetical protein COHA_006086 [Chlorella ohadii]|uniref:Cyanocobalamin reductase (cyanide-eliminating) n=1 Tax=Chlorella ohadii TaxID=2649997 RepID=A0AAD5H171_9CHLO|nr:hypothetical protein COHA_006086 [Chlorella ohadii]